MTKRFQRGAATIIEIMEQVIPRNGWHTWLNTLSNVITIAGIIFAGGVLWNSVSNLEEAKQQHEARLSTLELKGSVGLAEHKEMNKEELANIKNRVAVLEALIAVVSDLKADQRVALSKLADLENLIRRHLEAASKP